MVTETLRVISTISKGFCKLAIMREGCYAFIASHLDREMATSRPTHPISHNYHVGRPMGASQLEKLVQRRTVVDALYQGQAG
jgi:hypothetical protein